MRAIRDLAATVAVGLSVIPAIAGAQALQPTTSDAWLANPAIPYPVAIGVPDAPNVASRSGIVVAPWTPRASFAPREPRVLRTGPSVPHATDPEISASVTFP